MKKRKNIRKRVKGFFRRYINGTKGAVSLLLAIVMLPFSSVALLIVESARYQNAAQLVDELLDCVGLSSIAEYDTYLENRFGLLAMSQGTDPADSYRDYLKENVSALSNNFSYTSSTVDSIYPLSDDGVLKSQLLEYSEIMVMAEAIYNGIDVDELMKKLYKQLGVEDLNKMADATSKVADVASSTADLVNSIKDGIEEYKKYNTQLAEYKTAVSTFQTEAGELITELTTAKNNLEEDDDPADIYDVQAVKDAVDACESARDTLAKEAGEMSDSVITMKTTLDKVFSTAKKIADNANSAQNAIDKATGTTLQEDCTTSTSDWIIEVAGEITTSLNATVKSTYSADMQNQSQQLDAQKTKVESVVCDRAAEEDEDEDDPKYYIDVNSTAGQVNADFGVITLDSVNNGFDQVMGQVIKDLDENKTSVDEGQTESMGKLLDVAAQLLKVTAFYNGELDANVASSAFYNYNAGDISFTSQAIMTSLTTVVQSGKDFVDGLTSLNILKALKAVAEFLVGIAEFLVSIVSWVVETFVNIGKLLFSGSEIYDTFLLAAYGVYNMPCRTTYETGKSLSGYTYNTLFTAMGGTAGNAFTGSLSDLNTFLSSTSSGSDPGFRGAEVEYLLIGSSNELLNQSAAFFNLYMLRMVLDLWPIFHNAQVKTMAGAATVAGWVVYLVLIIAEPMIDALLLVNGQSTYLIKDQVYLTPGGMILLLETLPSLSGLPDSTKDTIKDSMIADNGEAKASGTLKMNYQEHMLVLLLVTMGQPQLLARMKNLIQMEAAQNYKDSYEFKLSEADTYLKATVNGTLNSMFDMDALTSGGPFTISRTRYIGY